MRYLIEKTLRQVQNEAIRRAIHDKVLGLDNTQCMRVVAQRPDGSLTIKVSWREDEIDMTNVPLCTVYADGEIEDF